MKKILLTALIIINFSCAKNLGTDTGNPVSQGDQAPDPVCGGNARCMPTPFINILVGNIQTKIYNCSQSKIDNPNEFEKSIYSQTGLNLEIPIREINFTQLEQNYNIKKISVDSNSFYKCLDAIKELACDSNEFKAAYDVEHLADFTNIHRLFRSSPTCLTMFSNKD